MVESGNLRFRYPQRDAASAQKYVMQGLEMANDVRDQAG